MNRSINIRNLHKGFENNHVISDLSLSLTSGTVYGLVGLNGAGKTTLLRLLLGLLKPDSGTITINQASPWSHAASLYRNCGVVLENDGFWGNLTARENCSIYAAAKGVSEAELEQYLSLWWQSSPLFTGNKKVKTLSRGQRMQCALCRAFLGTPSFFFLDEPVIALDLNGYNHFKEMVVAAQKNGAVLIISSHQLDTIDELCNRVGILREGKLDEIKQLTADDRQQWYIDTDKNSTAAAIIASCGAEDIIFDNGYLFTVRDDRQNTPEIIRQLVLANIALREVKRSKNGYSTIIQSYYSSKDMTTT